MNFVANIEQIRERARARGQDGAVTSSYGIDPQTVVAMLNEALATEPVCILRDKRHHFMADGLKSRIVAEEFLEHAKEQQAHADRLAERLPPAPASRLTANQGEELCQ